MKWLLAAFAAVLVAALGGAAWLLGSEPGLHWAAARLQDAMGGKLVLRELRGALARDIRFAALGVEDGEGRFVLTDGRLRLELLAFLGGRAGIRELQAASLEIITGGDDEAQAPSRPPSLPLGVRVHRAEIGRVLFRGQVLEELRLRDAVLREGGALSAAAAFRVPHERYPAQLALQLGGTLERLDIALSGEVARVPVSAKVELAPGAPRPLAALEARAGPVDLRRLDARAPQTALTLHVRGKAGSEAALAGTVALDNAAPGALDEERLPVVAARARFSTDFSSASLSQLTLTLAPHGSLSGSGTLSPEGAELALRATGVDLRAVRGTLRETRLSGPLRLRLAPDAQEVQATLTYEDIEIRADVVRRGDRVHIRSARAVAKGGSASGSGELRLGEPLRFSARLTLAGFDPARFGAYPAGRLSGRLEASGAFGESASAEVRWTLGDSVLLGQRFASEGRARLSPGRVAGAAAHASLGGARLELQGDFGRPGDAASFELAVPQLAPLFEGYSGRLRASGRVSGSWREPSARVRVQAEGVKLPGGITLARVAADAEGSLARHAVRLGVQAQDVDLHAELRGGWKAGTWSGELEALRNDGRYRLRLAAPAALEVSAERVQLGRLAARLGDGRLLVEEARWREGRLETRGEFQGLPAQWLLLAAGLDGRARASLLLDGAWELRAAPRLDGRISLARAAGDLTLLAEEPVALGLRGAALEARFEDGRLQATGELDSKYGAATLTGSVAPQPGAPGLGFTGASPARLEAQVRFAELGVLAQPFAGEARVAGRIGAQVAASGTLAALQLTGTLTGSALALDVPPYGVYLEQGELRAVLEGEALRIEHFAIRAGEGRLVASGTVPLRDVGAMSRLQWRAERFRLLARSDLRLTVSGAGEAQIVGRRVALVGALHADQGFVDLEQERLPQLGDDVVIVGAPRPQPRERVRVPVALDVLLYLGNELEVRGHGLEGKLTGRLQVETTAEGELRLYGRIETVNATFRAYGQRLQVDPGVAIFDGPLDNPTLQMTAWRRNQQVEAGVQITGTARNPRVQLVSQPPVPEGERLSWLVLGRPPGEATKADLGLLQAAAGALLADGQRAPLDRRIARALGLDEISLRGSGEVADRVVALGKRLSDRLYVSYEQGLGAAASALVKLDLALTQRLSVRAETGTSSGVGLFYRFSWD